MDRTRGRPVLGAICGLLFGVFVAVDLQMFAIWPLDTLSVIGLPLVGLVLGIALALWAPFGRSRAAAASPDTADSPHRTDSPDSTDAQNAP